MVGVLRSAVPVDAEELVPLRNLSESKVVDIVGDEPIDRPLLKHPSIVQ